jgi:hypothetical protein
VLLTWIIIRISRARRRNVPTANAVKPVDSQATAGGQMTPPTEKSVTTHNPYAGGASKTDITGHSFTTEFLVVLYVTALLLFTRTLYRLAETAEGACCERVATSLQRLTPAMPTGFFGYAATNEWAFGVFEFAPVITAVLIWAVRPFKRYIDQMTVHRTDRVAV